jgi:hypothetical protein
MSDTYTTTDTPGVRGQTRSSWRGEDHLRGLLMQLYRENPDADRAELEELYLAEAKGPGFHALPRNEAFIDDALRRSFAADYARVHQPARPQRRVSAADLAAADQRLRTVVLLDLVEANGKRLGDCTAGELRALGGWRIKIADRIGDDSAIVRERISEAEAIELRDSSAEGAVQ